MKLSLKLVLPLLLVALGVAGRSWLLATGPQPPEAVAPHAVPLVQTARVHLAARQLDVGALGSVRPQRELTLAAEVGGRILWLSPALDLGGTFAAGEELARIDPTDAEQRLAAARAETARAAAALQMEEAAAASARADWAELGVGTASALARREPQVALARAAALAAEAAEAAAATARARCSLQAPIAGRTAARMVEAGAVIAPGAPLARLQSAREYEARLPLALADFDALGMGPEGPAAPLPVELRAQFGGAEIAWSAQLVALEPSLDPRDRTAWVLARLTLAPGEPAPPAGLFVAARILGRVVEGVAVLPRAALRGEGEVLVVDAEQRLRRRDVGVVQRLADEVVVRGLAEGERVCVVPPAIVVEGMSVDVAESR